MYLLHCKVNRLIKSCWCLVIPVDLTDEQLKEAFDAVLLARCAHEPTLSLEEVKQLLR